MGLTMRLVPYGLLVLSALLCAALVIPFRSPDAAVRMSPLAEQYLQPKDDVVRRPEVRESLYVMQCVCVCVCVGDGGLCC
jgi:hypothetical protein